MKKIFILIAVATISNVFAAETVVINDDLLEIKGHMPHAEKVGVIFNPGNVALVGGSSSVKAIALPVTNGPSLLKQSRVMLRNVDAVYLMQGRFVTAEKLAVMLVEQAQKTGVRIFSNDPALAGVDGVEMVGAGKPAAAVSAAP